MNDFTNLSRTKKRTFIIAEQHNACAHCGLSTWRGQPLTLELEHKDGNNENDSRDNLECICPNCHSLTLTWRGRNVNRRKKITDGEMIAKLRETGNMHKTLLFFGMAPKGGNYTRTKRLVEEHNIELTTNAANRLAMSPADVEMARTMRIEGESLRGIARRLGFSRNTITRALL